MAKQKSDWWEKFFKLGWQQFHHYMKSPEQTLREINLLDQILQQYACQKVLDVPCGAGRITHGLAERGYELHGLDFNQGVLDEAIAISKEKSLDIVWKQGDMRELPYQEEFDMLMCFYGSFGYFDDQGNEAFVVAANKALKKGGYLLIDVPIIDTILPLFVPQRYHQLADDLLVLEKMEFDIYTSRMKGTWQFIKDREMGDPYYTDIRLYTFREMIDLLGRNGFGNFDPRGNYDGDPFVFRKARRLIMVAQKL